MTLTDRRHRRRPPGPLLSLLIEGTPLVWTALVCAAIYYGLAICPAVPVFESTQDSTRCVLVSPAGAADIRSWERNLYDWAALRDPSLLVLPNERFGFSRERSAKLEVPSAAVPAYRFAMTPLGQSAAPPLALCGPSPGLAERLVAIAEPIRPPPPEPLVVVPLARAVFWRTPDGRRVGGLPVFDEREVRAATARERPPKGPTTLRLVHGDRLATTRVQLLSSCGNGSLDALAVAALRRAAGQQQMRESQKDAEPARAEFFPPPGADIELQVEWGPLTGPEPAPGTP
jgi:hypothetical protein